MNNNTIVPEGNIKVNAGELKRMVEITEKLLNNEEIRQQEMEYLKYFEKRYVELPAARLREQDMFSFVKRSRVIAVSEKDMEAVAEMEKSYMELRDKRISLQSELDKEKEKNQLYNLIFKGSR